ncbi:YggS family pyridoxal phosphate-dependent enzyme [Candidatus Peregrinibacteria bacterium]|nr:YggS family pyridoxal phosphate-dependent enzyme [Candidatus Peregrinibacteria bacterium]
MSIYENIQRIKSDVKESVVIVAVTKNQTAEDIKLVINNGIINIGESKWQEAKEKIPLIPPFATKHFIGHLQSNKVKDVVEHFDVIQSVDTLKLAEMINEECKKLNKTMEIMIQVNTSGEAQKSGVSPHEAISLINKVSKLPNIKLIGLMTIGVKSNDEEKIRKCFKLLKQIFDQIKNHNSQITYLSMGMSGDYKIAIEEGSTMVRIGKGLFG